MSTKFKVLCGTPEPHCSGGRFATDQVLKSSKAHAGNEEAFRCYARYLVQTLGYEQIGPREFAAPNGGPVRVLTKKIRYGGRLRTGKSGGEGTGGSRFMPDGNRTQGLIVG